MKALKRAVVLAAIAGPAVASEPFSIEVAVTDPLTGGVTVSTGFFSSIEDFVEAVDDDGLSDINTDYTADSAAVGTLSFRGLDAIATFQAGSDLLSVRFPDGVVIDPDDDDGDGDPATRLFGEEGEGRNASGEDYGEFLESNGEDILDQLARLLIERTALDPLAGNPNSLVDTMAAASFDALDDLDDGGEGDGWNGVFGAGVRLGRYSVDEVENDSVTLPLKYSFSLTGRSRVMLDAPIRYIETGSAQTGSSSFGVAVSVPVGDHVTLVPGVRSGAVGSLDLGSASAVGSASLGSRFRIGASDIFDVEPRAGDLSGIQFSLLNSAAYFHARPLPVSPRFDLEFTLENFILKNGAKVEYPLAMSVFDAPLKTSITYANTRILGDEVFIDNYHDISFDVTAGGGQNFGVGVQYSFGDEDFENFQLNFGYKF